MKALLFLVALSFTLSSTTFDNSSFVKDEMVVEMLELQFVKDVESSTLNANLDSYLSNFLDDISHISGHYAEKSDIYYYTVYGKKDGINSFEMLEVDQQLFQNNEYYKTSNVLLNGGCRKGFAEPSFDFMCEGTQCQRRVNRCLGFICPPDDCER